MPRGQHLKGVGGAKFAKGQSGNPKGRPVGSLDVRKSLERLLGVIVTATHPLSKEQIEATGLDLMLLKQIGKAISEGDTAAFNAILNRLEGTPIQRRADTDTDGQDKVLRFIFDD